MSKTEEYHGTHLGEMLSLAEIIKEPTLARIYTAVRRTGPKSVGDIVDELEIPQRTAYDYVDKLVDAGFLQTTTDTRPAIYTANEIDLTLSGDDETIAITPVLIEAIARSETDDDIAVYLDRHGVDGLATALDYAHKYVDGTITRRMIATELDISPLEAGIILLALEEIILEEQGG